MSTSRESSAPALAADPVMLRPDVEGREILVCIGGGIAAYKTATVVSRLAQAGARVTVAMTEAATRFVAPLTFQALSARPVHVSSWDHLDAMDPQHIALANRLDAALVAPCTMDCLARLATGRADDVVSLVLSAVDRAKTPVLLAPAMNVVMWNQPATRRNLTTLEADGFALVGPGSGWQACREVGEGRMSEPEELLAAVAKACRGRLRS
ncbi:MAG: flavoprotein [Phycisphaerae bacterium]